MMNDKGDQLVFKGFPDLSSDYKLVYYRTFTSDLSVFGISKGDKLSDLNNILSDYGYISIMDNKLIHFKKGRVTITVDIKKINTDTSPNDIVDIIDGFYIDLYCTDWLGKGRYK